ncbi:hypothetical protein JMN32_16745 [Fulvivirga sp. 29W222]|uniref:Uncharacterized protein n=1 Tax=Fulvivirga marina TaxID=2494733 RepID=A0A937FZP0_9BACT|nr:hypothetical protein [Fulvivirga marina]MBL6447967.1 hypothetical protein [Fulvivirga marina]
MNENKGWEEFKLGEAGKRISSLNRPKTKNPSGTWFSEGFLLSIVGFN